MSTIKLKKVKVYQNDTV